MLALQITSLKNFMSRLLTGDTFDIFLLEEASLTTAVSIQIDGRIHREFFPEEERTPERIPYEFQPWSEIKGLCYDLIKGRNTPLGFKFVLQLKPEKMTAMLEKEMPSGKDFVTDNELKSLILTVKYEGGKAVLLTGSSYRTFVLDKTADEIWDRQLCKYLSGKGIDYEIL